MVKKSKLDATEVEDNKNAVKGGLEQMRSYRRRTVVWPAILNVNEFEFKCMLYDISLGGVRLKLDLPLATGSIVQIKIKDFEFTDALVSWHADAFVGLKFIDTPENIQKLLGEYTQNNT